MDARELVVRVVEDADATRQQTLIELLAAGLLRAMRPPTVDSCANKSVHAGVRTTTRRRPRGEA